MNTRSSYELLDEVGRPAGLLPPAYRWVGGAVAVLGATAFVILVTLAFVPLGKYVGGLTTMMGLAIWAFSQEPNEDEMTRKLRLESAFWAMMVGVSMLVGANSFSYWFEGQPELFPGTGVMCAILGFYLAMFHGVLRRLRTEQTDDQ